MADPAHAASSPDAASAAFASLTSGKRPITH